MQKVFLFCLCLALFFSLGAHSATYSRTVGKYTIQNGGNCWHVAYKLYSDKPDFFINQVVSEIKMLNSIDDSHEIMGAGKELKYPKYRYSSRNFCGDLRNWKYAVNAGYKYSVCPALLIGIRTHENPSSSRDHYAYGVKKYKHTNLETQSNMAARALSKYNVSWSRQNPTRNELERVGRIYCPTGPAHWAKQVSTIRGWALGG